jgi:hypothetical protein
MPRDLVVICDLPLNVGDARQYYGAARDLAFIASVAAPLESKFYSDAKKTFDAALELLSGGSELARIAVTTPLDQIIPAHRSLCDMATDVWLRAASINIPQVRDARVRLAELSSSLQGEVMARRPLPPKPKSNWVLWVAGLGVVSAVVYAVKRRS